MHGENERHKRIKGASHVGTNAHHTLSGCALCLISTGLSSITLFLTLLLGERLSVCMCAIVSKDAAEACKRSGDPGSKGCVCVCQGDRAGGAGCRRDELMERLRCLCVCSCATWKREDPRPAAGWIVNLNPVVGEMHSAMKYVNKGVYQQLEWGCSLCGLYVLVPVTEETEIQGPRTTQTV